MHEKLNEGDLLVGVRVNVDLFTNICRIKIGVEHY